MIVFQSFKHRNLIQRCTDAHIKLFRFCSKGLLIQLEVFPSCVLYRDLERLVIETARMKCSLPPDLYKEVILAFRKRSDDIVPSKIVEYLDRFPKRDRIERIIDEEVF